MTDTDDDGRRSSLEDVRLLLSNRRARRRAGELVLVLLAWVVLFSYVVGPLLGFPPGIPDDGDSVGRDLPDTDEEWAVVLLGTPVLFAYVWARARLAGTPPATFWKLRRPEDGTDPDGTGSGDS